MCSNTNFNPFASNIGRKLSLSGISIVLSVDILKKSARHLKTNTEKRAALFCYIYTFMNEEKGYLQNIILENYKE